MLLVLAVHRSTPNIEKLAADLKRRGGYPEHTLRIISSREDEELAYRIGDELADSFPKGRATTETLPALTPRFFQLPAPVQQTFLANAMFKKAMAFLEGYQYGPDEVPEAPMLYFHPLYRPTQQGWLNDLQSEFFLKGAPPVMARFEMIGLRTDRNVKNPNVRQVTVGPVIFGRKCLGNLPLLGYLDDKEHWRSRMVHELASGAVATKAIGGGKNSLLKEMLNVKVPV
jgi:hypothetical protein